MLITEDSTSKFLNELIKAEIYGDMRMTFDDGRFSGLLIKIKKKNGKTQRLLIQEGDYVGISGKKILIRKAIEYPTYNLPVSNLPTAELTSTEDGKYTSLYKKLYDFSMEHGGDTIDWSNESEPKWGIRYREGSEDRISISFSERLLGVVYFKELETAKEALTLYRKEIDEMLGVKEGDSCERA